MLLAPRPTSDSGMSEQSRQSVVPPVGAVEPLPAGVASPDPSGANVGTVQPATARTVANRSPATRRRRRGTITAFRRLLWRDRGYPVDLRRFRSAAGEHLGQIELDRAFELVIRAGPGLPIGPPALELRGV